MIFLRHRRRLAPLGLVLLLGSMPAVFAQQGAALPIQGELKQWHKLTFDFLGPESSESAIPNPFTDYRLDVTFTHAASGATHVVPGYFAADGKAADTSAQAGNVWRVHFAPGQVGAWTYSVSFRSGANVAVADDPLAGAGAGHFDGAAGSFVVDPSDKGGRDFRAKGRLEYVGRHHLRHAGTGEYFMKAGVDSPENLLAYADFDGEFKVDGREDALVKTWTPHLADWREGDPTWQDGKGKGLIGALNYLASEGLNSVSFLTFNIDGDDCNVFPYTTYEERSRMDVSRLDQWEIVFGHATQLGLYLHFKTQETENERLLDSGNTGNQRKLYYRELIARFSHHLALNWNLGEEINDASTAQKQGWAAYFRDHDPYRHHVVIHNGDQHFDLMGQGFDLTGMSLQLNEADFGDTFYHVRRYVKRSTELGKPWVVGCDEPGNASASLRPDSDPGTSHVDARRDALWATFLAGGTGCEFYFGYNYPNSDLTCQDFRSRDAFWDHCRHALQFFQATDVPFEQMTNHNELVSGAGTEATSGSGSSGNRCLAKIGHTYLVQLRAGGSHTLDLTQAGGDFAVKWFDPRNGGPLVDGSPVSGGGVVPLGSPPDQAEQDWIVLVQSTGAGSATNHPPVVSAGTDQAAFLTGATVDVALGGSVSDDGLPDEFSLTRAWSMVSGPAVVSFSDPQASITTASFSAAGTYVLRLHASDSDLSHADDVKVVIQQPDTGGELAFSAIHDAFTDQGVNDHGESLQVAGGTRVAYLQFDLTTLGSAPAATVLRLTESANREAPLATLRVFAAVSNDWNEETLTAASAPAKGPELAVHSGPVAAGGTLELDLAGAIQGPGIYSFILEADEGTSLDFASDESPAEGSRPELVVTTATNAPPEFSGFLLATPVNTPATIPHAWLLAAASDPDGDPLSLATGEAGSTTGGYVIIGEDTLDYAPSIDFQGEDSFPVSIGDGRGGTVTAMVQVQVVASDGIGHALPKVERAAGQAPVIRFSGLPGFVYRVERSTDLVSWITLGSRSGGITGEIEFSDAQAPEGAAFYRISTP